MTFSKAVIMVPVAKPETTIFTVRRLRGRAWYMGLGLYVSSMDLSVFVKWV